MNAAARRGVIAVALVAVVALIPFVGLHLPWVLPSTVNVVNSTGTLEVLALCFIFAGVALGYDVIFGYTGQPVRIVLDEVVERLGEGEGDHGEGDAADA